MKKRRRAYKKYDWKSHKILMPRRYNAADYEGFLPWDTKATILALNNISVKPDSYEHLLDNLMNKELKEAFIKAGLFESINAKRENYEHIN